MLSKLYIEIFYNHIYINENIENTENKKNQEYRIF